MKYRLINIFLKVPKALGIVSGKVLKFFPHPIKKGTAEIARKSIAVSFSKFRPIVYTYFYELIKHSFVGRSFFLYKDIGSGVRMQLDLSKKTQRQIYLNEKYEEPVRSVLENHLKEGDIFIDVGSNVGYYALITSKIVGSKGTVIAFEPESENFQALIKNIELNNFKNITPENKALGSHNVKQKLYLNPLNEGGHSLVPMIEYSDSDKKMSRKEIENAFPELSLEQDVDTLTLDEYIQTSSYIKNISAMKIDVEGFEGEVIKGMKLILEKKVPEIIVCEIGESESEALEILRSYGYFPYTIGNKGQISALHGKTRSGVNYLFKKNE
jgi:FkbM family methyltransferase